MLVWGTPKSISSPIYWDCEASSLIGLWNRVWKKCIVLLYLGFWRVGNRAKMRLEIIMIFFIVKYAFILVEEMEDYSFSNLSGKFGVRLTCITSKVKSFLQVLLFNFPKYLKKPIVYVCVHEHIYLFLNMWFYIGGNKSVVYFMLN